MSFIPNLMTITSITQANPAVVTVAEPMYLTTGQVVRIVMPLGFGMNQLNKQLVQITVLSPTTFSLQYSQANPKNVDSTQFYPFVNANNGQFPQAIPVGSGSTPLTQPFVNVQNRVCVSELEDAANNQSLFPIPF